MTDLYAVLGIGRGASPEEVRAAYRKLALELHPDRGGDPAAFQAATEAHDVLSDPGVRVRYDLTGEVRTRRDAAHPDAELLTVLVPVMHAGLKEMAEQYGEGRISRGNLLAFMKRVLEKERRGRKERVKLLEQARAAFAVVADRFREPDDRDLLAAAARHHLAQIDRQTGEVIAEEARIGRALDYLAACGYDFEAGGLFAGSAATTSASLRGAAFWGLS